jgi:PDGLE domain-containing protein
MRANARLFVIAGLLVAAGLALLASPFASRDPDGLERVARDEGILDEARAHGLAGSPVAGYAVRGVEEERLSTGLSGLVGVLLTFGAGTAAFALLRTAHRRRSRERRPA